MANSPEHFEAVVVGSGFGGSVVAYRLAEAGIGTCLLERGKAYPPGSFPRTPHAISRNFWDPSRNLFGLYNVWSFKGSGALVSSGLGGGSLIYANVLIRKDEKWFEEDVNGIGRAWPISRRDLDIHYDRVERMMNVQKYPLGHPPYDQTLKTLAMKEAGSRLVEGDLKAEWLPLNLAVSFRRRPVAGPDDDDPSNPPVCGAEIPDLEGNYHTRNGGREFPRSTCRLCGECDLGCNFGSKNTLDLTYLSAAIRQPTPSDIRLKCEVKKIARRGDGRPGYRVEYVVHDTDRDLEATPSGDSAVDYRVVTCDRLVLAAGTFGSPYLLMKNRPQLPNLSAYLGKRYSVNGDLLSFVVKAAERRNGHGAPRSLDPTLGPVITSALRFADDLDGAGNGRGFYVEDGGHPYLMSWMAELGGFKGFLKRSIGFLKIVAKYRLGFGFDADLGAEVSDLIGRGTSSMCSMPILSMGRDNADASLSLTPGGLLECDWAERGSREYYDRIRRAGRAIAKALGAEYEDNPSYRFNFNQVMTAHPLGGCSMGLDGEPGVVNACGEVHGHPNLFVVDGSVMPGPIGPNPSLTIAAFADRVSDHIVAARKGENHECHR